MDDVIAYAEDAQFNYPILVGETDAMEVAESSGVPFIGLPFTMIVAASGELIDTHVGEIEAEHIDHFTAVLDEMDEGTLDLAGAWERLRKLCFAAGRCVDRRGVPSLIPRILAPRNRHAP